MEIKMNYISILSYFCEIHGPSLMMATMISKQKMDEILPKVWENLEQDTFSDCEYCKSFDTKNFPCLVTYENNATFVSSRNGLYETKVLKHASMRCLSCESGTKFAVSDNLIMGDIVCYNFRVPDEKARGLSRLYSLR